MRGREERGEMSWGAWVQHPPNEAARTRLGSKEAGAGPWQRPDHVASAAKFCQQNVITLSTICQNLCTSTKARQGVDALHVRQAKPGEARGPGPRVVPDDKSRRQADVTGRRAHVAYGR